MGREELGNGVYGIPYCTIVDHSIPRKKYRMEEKKYRPHELEKFKAIWLTSEAYKVLRKQKKLQRKSMARIVDDLIKEKYGKRTM